MYNWDYFNEQWTQEEQDNNCKICQDFYRYYTRLFHCTGFSICDEFVNDIIIKNVIDNPTKDYKICATQKLKRIIEQIITILKLNPEYTDKDIMEELKHIYDACSIQKVLEVKNILKVIESLEGIKDEDNLLPELIKQLKRLLPKNHLMLGEFCSDTKKIIIYMKNIREIYPRSAADIVVEEVIAHELFHYYHYTTAYPYVNETWSEKNKEYATRESYKKSAVKESLADAFAYLYLKEKEQIDIAAKPDYQKAMKNLKEKWDMYDYPYYPYSGAKAFLIDNQYAWDGELFKLVYEEAKKRWRLPYKIIKVVIDKKNRDAGIMEYRKKYDVQSPLERIAERYPETEQAEIIYLIERIMICLKGRINVDRFLKAKYSLDEIQEVESLLSRNYYKIQGESKKTILEKIYRKEIDELNEFDKG